MTNSMKRLSVETSIGDGNYEIFPSKFQQVLYYCKLKCNELNVSLTEP